MMDSRRSSGMFAKETIVEAAVVQVRLGRDPEAAAEDPRVGHDNISFFRRDGASPSSAIETGKPGNRCSWRSAQYR